MGVFARLFRRPKTTEETAAAEARADGVTAGAGAEDGIGAQDAAGTTEPKGTTGAPETAEPAVREAGRVTGTEAVDIPKQQSSEAAGSEAGEGART
ncbi:hypothetical protein ACIF9R_19535 [Streptomyces sp. NPDC086080]|uniref:hypothetical protein n=1 Tax=Streptomyces sp. NPDC086080 TaxID=3365748 RepID=UPI0037D15F60